MKNALSNVYLAITEVRQYLNISWSAAYELLHCSAIPRSYFRNSTRIYTNCAGG